VVSVLSPELFAYRSEVRDFIFDHWRSDKPIMVYLDSAEGKEEALRFRRELGKRRWLSQSWPTKFGGQGKRFLYQYVLTQELAYYEAPYNYVAIGIVAPVLIRHGTAEQQARFLEPIASGELEFCLGYSEPSAGTDLGSLTTRARKVDDGWIVSGTKLWISGAHKAKYCWLAARTGSKEDGRKGISLFAVDIESPQVEVRPVMVMDGRRTNEVVFHDLRVPPESLIGEVNQGWNYLSEALAHERFMAFPLSRVRATYDRLLRQLSRKKLDGAQIQAVATLHVKLESLQLLADRMAITLDGGELSAGMASMLKIGITEYQQTLASASAELLGEDAMICEGSLSIERGHFEYFYRYAIMPRFGAGTNDVIRVFVARLIRDMIPTYLQE
jgi:3-oxocholest-4-en-26-oyl-CoA dehydrogenase alpha subunit